MPEIRIERTRPIARPLIISIESTIKIEAMVSIVIAKTELSNTYHTPRLIVSGDETKIRGLKFVCAIAVDNL
jgi:hypothetical protein